MDEKHYRAVLTGQRSRAAGEYFERIISNSCLHYHEAGLAEIEKTPEPTRQLTKMDRYGRFTACYEKRAQPDYKGTVAGGRSVVFEAKHTDADRIKREAVTQAQEERLERHEKLGAECFVLVSFGFEAFFKVPWAVFRDMKEKYGRKYATPDDLAKYRIKYGGGVLYFL